ncbi:ImmA/IrrE family metallo-endopeptidase [Streptomyces sp. NPDC048479]|uniref:ImmA/IrrE family metallo-endopeptidase n=1 Tax=Streptomyces sp. NPDC048479 TaxID=3154725 RepID=UPI0034388AF4
MVSALTVHAGPRRHICVNDAHEPPRQNSSISQELSHALLLHPPGPARDATGCRHWDGDVEDEADWLAGSLLITNEDAWSIARGRMSDDEAPSGCREGSEAGGRGRWPIPGSTRQMPCPPSSASRFRGAVADSGPAGIPLGCLGWQASTLRLGMRPWR